MYTVDIGTHLWGSKACKLLLDHSSLPPTEPASSSAAAKCTWERRHLACTRVPATCPVNAFRLPREFLPNFHPPLIIYSPTLRFTWWKAW